MSEFDESDRRHKIYREQHKAFLAAVERCHSLRRDLEKAIARLERVAPAPQNIGGRTIAPPQMPATRPASKPDLACPSKAEIEDALTARDIARQGVIDDWNDMSKDEQNDAKKPPEALSLFKKHS